MLSNVIHKVNQVFSHQNHHNLNWDDDFSGMTELEALIEVKDQLSKIDFLKQRNLKDKIQLVLNMDEKSYRKVQNITYNYLISIRNNGNLKRSVAVVVYEYLRQLSKVYILIFDECFHQNKLKLNTETINLIIARNLNAAFMMAKWRYFADQPAPLGVWSNVHKIIKISEDLLIMNKSLFLYDFQNKETSIATILEGGFMLDTLQKGSYSQLQIELTNRMLKTWSSNPLISKEYKHNEYQFFIHLDDDNGPQRLRGAQQHLDFRYWKTSRIVDLMETYLCAADARKSLDEFNFITMATTEDVVQLFKKLRVDWRVEGYKRQCRNEQKLLNTIF